jgi:hypothetical protein
MLFAHLKCILRLGRLRLRGSRGAQDEFTLAAVAQNLRRLAKLVARPPPAASDCLARQVISALGPSISLPEEGMIGAAAESRVLSLTAEIDDFRNKICQ